MTARDDLYDAATDDDVCDCYPDGAAEINARIDAYRDEVLREAAAKIRDAETHREGGEWLDTASGLLDAADQLNRSKES